MLGLRDDGRTVTVARTSRITVSLPGTYRWSTPELTGARATVSEVVSDAPSGGQLFEVVDRPACVPSGPELPR